MNFKLLLPRFYQLIGLISFIIFATLGMSNYSMPGFRIAWLPAEDIWSSNGNDLTNEVAIVGSVIGLLLLCFAREKREDEYTFQIRLISWQWSIIISTFILIIINFTTYGLQFNALLIYHAYASLILFIIIFHYNLYNPGRKRLLLIPLKFKRLGWIVLVVFIPLGLASIYLGFEVPGLILWGDMKQGNLLVMPNSFNLTNELILTGILAGLLMICFARHKNEDEYISYLRLTSWQWSIFISSLIFILITFFCYGSIYYHVLLYNIFTPLAVFIARFNYKIDRLNKSTELES